MCDSHIDSAQCYKTLEVDELMYLEVDSELLLSHISYMQQPESPRLNVNAVEAKIKELTKTAEPPIIKKSKPYCGCGQYYSCTSSLYLHIRSKHGGIAPPGTIGGPKGIVKKPNQDAKQQIKMEQSEQARYNTFSNVKTLPTQPQNSAPALPPEKIQNAPANQVRRDDQSSNTKNCKICGKGYSCNSSLNLHMKRKHQVRRLQNGRLEVEARPEDKQQKSFQCKICGLSYGSKSALGLHYNNKHNSQSGNNQFQFSDGNSHKCGCGLVYQSRSALNMHVKKKHQGAYPQGTSQKPNLRAKGRSSQNYVFQAQEEDKHSIYDSEEEGKSNHYQKMSPLIMPTERIFRCGCGRNYSCSSSLNLHIKKNHNWTVPKGTIGGPRGMRNEEEKRNLDQSQKNSSDSGNKEGKVKQDLFCGECNADITNFSHFQCRKCEKHEICSSCFWAKDNFGGQHEWVVTDPNDKQ